MKVTIHWLNEFIPNLRWDAEMTAEKLTRIGHETEPAGNDCLDVTTTPNRLDCQSVIGLSRDLAGAYDLTFTPPPAIKLATIKQIIPVIIDRSATEAVLADLLLGIEGYRPTKSPKIIRDKMTVLDLEPKDLIIDLSNIVAYETGIPLHVFDGAKISNGLTIRRAKKNEKIQLLNGQTLTLSPDNIVQESGGALVDLAGIMGSNNSAVGPTTTSLIVQAAIFTPMAVRQSRKILSTPAAKQYSRGVEQAAVLGSLERLSELLER